MNLVRYDGVLSGRSVCSSGWFARFMIEFCGEFSSLALVVW